MYKKEREESEGSIGVSEYGFFDKRFCNKVKLVFGLGKGERWVRRSLGVWFFRVYIVFCWEKMVVYV